MPIVRSDGDKAILGGVGEILVFDTWLFDQSIKTRLNVIMLKRETM